MYAEKIAEWIQSRRKWRRDRDLNPGGGFSAYTLSRRAP
jgi:hypothetical protein